MILDIREAEPADVVLAAALWLRAEAARTGQGTSDEQERAFADSLRVAAAKPGAILLVGRHDDCIVATIYGVQLRKDPTAAQVAMLAVEPQLWGGGIGSRMLNSLMERLAEAGCTQLRMNVAADNHRAQGLYERHGWRHSGEVEKIAPDVPPELIYRYGDS